MQRLFLFLLILMASSLAQPQAALALAPEQYALQVLQKDLPQAIRWFGQLSEASKKSQAEVYSLYQSALPEAQTNHQKGISTKGSIERMLLLLEGARYFEQVQKAPLSFQNKKELVLKALQNSKDQLDRIGFGEDPQILLEEQKAKETEIKDATQFSADLVEVFTELQKLLSQPAMVALENSLEADAEAETETATVQTEIVAETESEIETEIALIEPPKTADKEELSFETQRFVSYIETAESGKVAEECLSAKKWKTDRAESCQSDESVECDRSYARQCKKLQ